MLTNSYLRKALNSLLPQPFHVLMAPFYNFRKRKFDADWSQRTNESSGNRPDQYIELDKKTKMVADWVDKYGGKDCSVLDLCCNVGRLLAELWNRGYRSLQGVDVNANAIRLSGKYFGDMARDVKLTVSPLEVFLAGLPDKSIDCVVSRGTSIEFVAPDFPLVGEICRVARRSCVLLLQPSAMPYPRFWEYEFRRHGFILADFHYYPGGGTNTFCFISPETVKELEQAP